MPQDKETKTAPQGSHRYSRAHGVVGLIVGLLGVGAILYLAWHRPLGPELVQATPFETQPSATLPLATSTGMASVSQLVPPTLQPICGGSPLMYLMMVGTDTHYHDYTGFADVIRIARIDFVAPSVNVLAVPRDLWVRIPGLETHHIIENRIKTAYSYGNYYLTAGGGPSLLTQTLTLNFDIRVDHYMIIDFSDFERAIDAVGGVDLTVPQPVRAGGIYFPAGRQHLDGAQALVYARVRDDISDLDRIDRQTELLWAIREKVMTAKVLPQLDDLAQPILNGAVTDMSPAEISTLMCLGKKIDPAQVKTMTIGGSMVHAIVDPWDHEILEPDFDAIKAGVDQFNAGQPGFAASEPATH